MQNAAEAAPSRSPYAYGEGGERRGAGGKLKKSFTRRQPSTPYDRPPTVVTQSSGGWISKLINPAYRLIADGATRLLPSVFSDSRTLLPLPRLSAPNYDDGGERIRTQDIRSDDHGIADSSIKIKSPAAENHSGREENPEGHGLVEEMQGKFKELPRATELSDLEKKIEQSTLCSEDIDRLTKILHSKLVEQDLKLASTSTSGEVSEANRASEKTHIEKPRMEDEEIPEDEGNLGSAFSTPLLQSTVQDEIGLSPVELAKAFMTSWASKHDTETRGGVVQDERPLYHIGMTPNRVLESSTPRSSIRWPGAMLQEENRFATPHSGRNSNGPTKHPRTPYSRAIYSESKSKLKPFGGESRKPYISYSPFSQKGLPPHRQSILAEDGHASVGPIRSTRHKFTSKSHVNESPSFWSSEKDISNEEDWAHQDSSVLRKNQGHEPHRSPSLNTADQRGEGKVGAFTGLVHPHTSKLARDILDQISKPPTLREKSDEWKLVLARRNSSVGDVATTVPKDPAADKEKGSIFKLPSQYAAFDSASRDLKSSASDAPLQRINRIFDGVKTQDTAVPDPQPIPSGNYLQDNGRNIQNQVDGDPRTSKSHNQSSTAVKRQYDMHGLGNRLGSRPKLPPISVEKSNTGVKFGFNHCNTVSPSFTFQTSTISSSLSEPPTPSVMPVSSIVDNTVSPTFTFGEDKKSAPPLVFAFPSSSTNVMPDDEPKFKFGSDKRRVSFALIGKDEVCC